MVEKTIFQKNMIQVLQRGIIGSKSKELELDIDMQKMFAGGAGGAYYELTRPLDRKPTRAMIEEVNEIVSQAKDFQPWSAGV